MKIFTLLVALAFINVSMANTHKPHPPVFGKNNRQQPVAVPLKNSTSIVAVSSANKDIADERTGNASRLIALSYYNNDGTNFYPVDSGTLTYPGSGLQSMEGNDATNWEYAPYWSVFDEWINNNTTNPTYTQNEKESVAYYANTNNIHTVSIQIWDSMTSSFRNYLQEFATWNSNNQLTTVTVQAWDTTNNVWVNDYKDSEAYNGSNKEILYLYSLWNGTAWANSDQYLYTYDNNGNETSEIYQEWLSNAWVNNWQDLFTYDSNNNELTYLYQTWVTSAWVNYSEYLYSYNSSNQDTAETYQYWTTLWVPEYHYKYTYSGNNEASEIVQYWGGVAWINEYEYNYSYDGNNNQTLEVDLDWDNINMVWDNNYEYAYVYDGNNNETSETDNYYKTSSSTWVGVYKYIYTFDGSNNQISEVDQDTASNGSWLNTNEYLDTYNSPYNQITSYMSLTWNSGGSLWQGTTNDNEDFYYYGAYTAGINQLSNIGAMDVYPNPANNFIHANITLNKTANLQLRLVNVLGQTVWSTDAGNVSYYMDNISVSNLSDGVYLLVATSGNATQTQQVVVTR